MTLERSPDRKAKAPSETRSTLEGDPRSQESTGPVEGTLLSTCDSLLRAIAAFEEVPLNGPDAPLRAGDSLLGGRLRIERLVGEGGMGAVYAATDEEAGARVAIKTLHHVAPERLLLLKQEFRSLLNVHHPGLVRPGELHEEDGRWFFTMELLDGFDLRSHLRHQPDEVRSRLVELAEILSALHHAGLVHCDVKPDNVLVTRDGDLKLLDFGLARTRGHATLRLAEGAGTLRYMPLEQHRAGNLTAAADWYAFGVIVHECAPAEFSALQGLSARLRSDHPEARPSGDEVLAVLRGTPASRTSGSPQGSTFVGRREELAILQRAAERADRGRSAAVFVSGPSGIGKSAILDAFAQHLPAGAVILRGRCYQRESLPFKAVDGLVDDLATVVESLPVRANSPVFVSAIDTLGRSFPAFAAAHARTAESTAGRPTPPSRTEIARALDRLLRALERDGLVVAIVDDLQWSDADGTAVLRALFSAPGARRMLVTAARPGVHEGIGIEGEERLTLAGLDRGDVETLANELGADATRIDTAIASADGHPLFVRELLRSGGTEEMHFDALLRRRVRELTEDARHVLEALVLLETPTERVVIEQISHLGREAFERALAILDGQALIKTPGVRALDRVEVFHDRVREALRTELSDDQQKALHGAALTSLLELDLGPPERRARHAEGTGDFRRTVAFLEAGAGRAEAAGAFGHAADLLGWALRVASPDEKENLLARRSEALAAAWQPIAAAEAFLTREQTASRDAARELRKRAGEQLFLAGEMDRGFAAVAPELLRLRAHPPRHRTIAFLLAPLARARYRFLELTPTRAPSPGSLPAVDFLLTVGLSMSTLDPIRAVHVHAATLSHAHRSGDAKELAKAAALEGILQVGAGDVDRGRELAEEAQLRLHQMGRVPQASAFVTSDDLIRGCKLMRSVMVDDWRAARAIAQDRPEESLSGGSTAWLYATRVLTLAQADFQGGEYRRFLTRFDGLANEANARQDPYFQLCLDVWLGPVAAILRDDVPRAKRHLANAEGPLSQAHSGGYFHALRSLSATMLALYAGEAAPPRESYTARVLMQASNYGRAYLRFFRALVDFRDRSSLRRLRILHQARILSGDRVPYASPLSELLVAQATSGRIRDSALLRAEAGFAALGLRGFAAVAAVLRGLRPGALHQLEDQGVRNPERYAALFAGGRRTSRHPG